MKVTVTTQKRPTVAYSKLVHIKFDPNDDWNTMTIRFNFRTGEFEELINGNWTGMTLDRMYDSTMPEKTQNKQMAEAMKALIKLFQ